MIQAVRSREIVSAKVNQKENQLILLMKSGEEITLPWNDVSYIRFQGVQPNHFAVRNLLHDLLVHDGVVVFDFDDEKLFFDCKLKSDNIASGLYGRLETKNEKDLREKYKSSKKQNVWEV